MAQTAKDFLSWHQEKEKIHALNKEGIYFNEREIWWCSVGINIGHEEDGKGDNFRRPVIIFRKFNRYTFWGIPLTSQIKFGDFFYVFPLRDGRKNTALLSQMRMFDVRRLLDKAEQVPYAHFLAIQKKITNISVSNPV